jgi:hypothetical protein
MPYDPIRSRQAPGSSRAPDPVDTTDTAHRHGQDHEHGNRNRPRRAFGISWPGWFRECQPGAPGGSRTPATTRPKTCGEGSISTRMTEPPMTPSPASPQHKVTVVAGGESQQRHLLLRRLVGALVIAIGDRHLWTRLG